MRRTVSVFGTILLIATASDPAGAAEIVCPEQIEINETVKNFQDNAWQAMIAQPDLPHHFYTVYFSAGPPTNIAILTPDAETDNKKKKIDTYNFSSPDQPPIWISCVYHDTSIVISRPLNEPHAQCTVTFNPITGFASVKEIECH